MADPKSTLITLADPRSPAAEAYRTLRTNLMFSGLDRALRTLVVTSPTPGVGKSITTANLAVTMAQSGKSTVLVDCDLRRPRQHEIWGVDNALGLTSMVLGEAEPPLVDVGVPNLWLLPSGPLPPNPADLLGSARMDEVISTLGEGADMLLFDTPPVIAVTDTALLATRLDGVLLVVRAGSTRRDHAQRAKELLERVNIRVVGAVITNAEVDTRLGGYYSD
jgi:capsular exopolysaccharide synthesis family protein